MINIANQIAVAPNAQIAAHITLTATDWTQLPNSGLTSDCVTAFATYRNAVRVIRRDSNSINRSPADYTWPSMPAEDWA